MVQVFFFPAGESHQLIPYGINQQDQVAGGALTLLGRGAHLLPTDVDVETAGLRVVALVVVAPAGPGNLRPAELVLVVGQGAGVGDDLDSLVAEGTVVLHVDGLVQLNQVVRQVVVVVTAVHLQLHTEGEDAVLLSGFAGTILELGGGLVAVVVEAPVLVLVLGPAVIAVVDSVVLAPVGIFGLDDASTVITDRVIVAVPAVIADDCALVVLVDVAVSKILTTVVTAVVVVTGTPLADVSLSPGVRVYPDGVVHVEDFTAVVAGEVFCLVASGTDGITICGGEGLVLGDPLATVGALDKSKGFGAVGTDQTVLAVDVQLEELFSGAAALGADVHVLVHGSSFLGDSVPVPGLCPRLAKF